MRVHKETPGVVWLIGEWKLWRLNLQLDSIVKLKVNLAINSDTDICNIYISVIKDWPLEDSPMEEKLDAGRLKEIIKTHCTKSLKCAFWLLINFSYFNVANLVSI